MYTVKENKRYARTVKLDSARAVSIFLLGRCVSNYTVKKDDKVITLTVFTATEIEKALTEA